MGDGDWVFPSRTRTLKQTSSLVNAIKSSKKEAGVDAHVHPHGMRYAFNDLLRAADIDPVVRRSLIGHVTEEMQEHYSTLLLDEKREAMEKVATKLAEVRQASEGEKKGDVRGYAAEKREAA